MTDRVSCLCVTRGPWLPNALRQFDRQTYPDRELVVIHQGLSVDVLRDLEHRAAVVVEAPRRARLGALRNLAVAAASGEWCIQWDDDDAFHASRIEAQLAQATRSGTDAQFLTSWFMRDLTTGDVFQSFRRLWEGSLLARRSLLQRHCYDATLAKAEDSALARALVTHAKSAVGVHDAPHLYLYQHHGANTWARDHFAGLFERSRLLDPMESARVLQTFE